MDWMPDGMSKAILSSGGMVKQVKKACPKCALCMPVYPGRYPMMCPGCGSMTASPDSEFGGEEKSSSAENIKESQSMNLQEMIVAICEGKVSPDQAADHIFESFTTANGTMTIGGPGDVGEVNPQLDAEMKARKKRKVGNEFNGFPEEVHLGGTRRPAR